MALAIFDARPDRVQVGDLFDTNKRYVYRDPLNGAGSYARDPSSGSYYDAANRYWVVREYEGTSTVKFDSVARSFANITETQFTDGLYVYYRGDLISTSVVEVPDPSSYYDGSYSNYFYYNVWNYGIYRVQARNPNIIRYPLGPTIVGSGKNLTYEFDDTAYWINNRLYVGAPILSIGIL